MFNLSRIRGLHQRIAEDARIPGRVRCGVCGAERDVDPATCLAKGWPACCGLTMALAYPVGGGEG